MGSYINFCFRHLSKVLKSDLLLYVPNFSASDLFDNEFYLYTRPRGDDKTLRGNLCGPTPQMLTTVRDPPRWPRGSPIPPKVGTKFHRQVAGAQSV
jgi:hypothetical protein